MITCWILGQRHDREQYFCLLLELTPVNQGDGQLNTSVYDICDDFNVNITNFLCSSSNTPSSPVFFILISLFIRYARACSSHECFIPRATRLCNKGYAKERYETSLRNFYDWYGDLITQYQVPLSRMLNYIL